jgi:hypothetical protein
MKRTSFPTAFALAKVVQAVADGFPNFHPEITFEQTVRKSVSQKSCIVSYKVDRKESNVILVTEKDDPMSGMLSPKSVYSVVRLFPLGDKWEISFDVSDAHPAEVFDCLLDA